LESNGWITGTPLSAGAYTFTVMVIDTTGFSAAGTYTLNVDEIPEMSTVTPVSDGPIGKTDQMWASGKHVDFLVNYPVDMLDLADDQYLAVMPMVMGKNTPWSFTAIGLPKGLTCDAATGFIQGPVDAFADGNVKTITITAKDANGKDAYFSPVTLSVRAGYVPPSPPPVIAGSNGILSVSTDRGMIISVSGTGDIGTGSAVIALTPGSYTVSIRNAGTGRVVWQNTVRIDSGKTTTIRTSGLN